MTDQLAEFALEWVNATRISRGGKPIDNLVPGTVASANSCVITNSLKGVKDFHVLSTVPGSEITPGDVCFLEVDGSMKTIELPDRVNWFVRHFDQGKYPEYEIGYA